MSENPDVLLVTNAYPDDIQGLRIRGTGSTTTFNSPDVDLVWTASGVDDLKRYKVSILNVDLTERRVVYTTDNFLLYSFTMNSEDGENDNTPSPTLIIRVWAQDYFNQLSTNANQVTLVNPPPANVGGLHATSFIRAAHFRWYDNIEYDFAYYRYRLKIGTGGWGDWNRTTQNILTRYLSTAEVAASGGQETVSIEVVAVDTFGSESPTPSSVSILTDFIMVAPHDIEDFAVKASALWLNIPVLEGDAWINDAPDGDSVTHNEHKLFYNGVEYVIAEGNTNKKYIYWESLNSNYSYSDTNPGLGDGEFVIATNVNGTHDLAWNAIANQVVGSQYIQDLAVINAKIGNLAVTNAKINDLDAIKITAGFIDVDRLQAGSILVAKFGADATNRMFIGSTRDYADIGGVTKPANNADVTGDNAQNLGWIIGTAGTLTIAAGGKLIINVADSLEITANGNIKVLAGGDINMYGAATNPALINFVGNDYTISLGIDNYATNTLFIYPDTDDRGIFNFGSNFGGSKRISNIFLESHNYTYVKSIYDANHDAYLWTYASSSQGIIGLHIKDGGVIQTIQFGLNYFRPNAAIDLGQTASRFRNLFLSGHALITDYLVAEGGVHIGGTSDPGTDHLIVDGTSLLTGVVTCSNLLTTVGGVHVGGTNDPGADNLIVDGISTLSGTVGCNRINVATGQSVGDTGVGARIIFNVGEIEFHNTEVGINEASPTKSLHVGVDDSGDGIVRANAYEEYSQIYIGAALETVRKIKKTVGSEIGDWADVDHKTLPIGVATFEMETWLRHKQTGLQGKKSVVQTDIKNVHFPMVYVPEEWEEFEKEVGYRDVGKTVQILQKAIIELDAEVASLKALNN